MPAPLLANVSLPGCFFASSTNSASVCAGTEAALTTTRLGIVAISVMGAKSRIGSYGSFS